MVRVTLIQSTCQERPPFRESIPTQLAALVVVAVFLASDAVVSILVLVVVGACVVFARNNCHG